MSRHLLSRSVRQILIMAAIMGLQACGSVVSGNLGTTKTVTQYSLAFSPDGKTVASGAADNTARLWNAHTGTLLHTLTGHTNFVNGVAFSPSGKLLASAGQDGATRLWDTASGTPLQILNASNGAPVNAVAFSPDGASLVTGGSDSGLQNWDPQTGQQKWLAYVE